MNNLRYLANLEIALALAGWAVGLWGIWRGEETILQYLYFFAWYPYIALPGRPPVPPPGPVLAPHSAPQVSPDVWLVRDRLAHL